MKQILEKPKKSYNHCGKAFFNEYILLVISAIVVSYFNVVKNKIYQKKVLVLPQGSLSQGFILGMATTVNFYANPAQKISSKHTPHVGN